MDPRSSTPSRNLIVEEIVARTGINEAMIDQLVRASYARARLDPLIGPIFESRVAQLGKSLQSHVCVLVFRCADERPLSRSTNGRPSAIADRHATFRSL